MLQALSPTWERSNEALQIIYATKQQKQYIKLTRQLPAQNAG
jgi:hypothetical protein